MTSRYTRPGLGIQYFKNLQGAKGVCGFKGEKHIQEFVEEDILEQITNLMASVRAYN